MKNAYYFISDAHFGLEDKDKENLKEKLFIQFLEDIRKNAKELYIVGDLFDFWIEYKYVVPKGYYRLFAKLHELVEDGIKIHYLAGNHDFWRGNYFKDEFGIEISDKPISVIIEDKKFYIHHGDGLAYNDLGYKIAKKILRNRFCQFLYSTLHPRIGIGLAKNTSSASRVHTSQKDYSQKDGLRDYALEKLNEGYNYVIMGHRHSPEILKGNGGCYINLGDWIENFSYGIFKEGMFELRQFYDVKENKITNEIIRDIG